MRMITGESTWPRGRGGRDREAATARCASPSGMSGGTMRRPIESKLAARIAPTDAPRDEVRRSRLPGTKPRATGWRYFFST
jgi:hypothetical protein